LIVRAPEPPQLSHRMSAMPQPEDRMPTVPGEAAVTLAAAPLVMVVDDSLTVRRVTQRLLERSGYEVLLAKDGVDALRQLQDVRPDVMLIDIEMPRMDGFDLTRHVRATELTRSIPIVMITSRTADKHRRMAMELGVNAYLGKPYQDDELLALIRSYLQERVVV
jgi:chemosensory pili system protein ChpA (sensor histidine kinase/response regulator)